MMFFRKFWKSKSDKEEMSQLVQLRPKKEQVVESKLDDSHLVSLDSLPPDPQFVEEFEAIKQALDWAKPYHLEVEVFHHAMTSLKRDPSQSIADVLSAAAWSWDL